MPSSTPKNRPGLLAWAGYAALVLLVLIILVAIGKRFGHASFRKTAEGKGFAAVSQNSSTPLFLRYEEGAEKATFAPPAAPMPGMPARDDFAYDTSAATGETSIAAPRVIKTGELQLRVEDAGKAVDNVSALVSARGGFVESSSIADQGSRPRTAWMTVRVPVDRFQETVNELKGLASVVLLERTNGQDVTAEFVDLEADLRNARAEEESYLEILERATEIEDVLAVTERLSNVRGRIERIEGRKRYLENRTDLATISLTLTEDTRIEAPTSTWRPGETLRSAMRELVEALQDLVDFLIRLVIGLIGLFLPVALLIGLATWVLWKIARIVWRRIQR